MAWALGRIGNLGCSVDHGAHGAHGARRALVALVAFGALGALGACSLDGEPACPREPASIDPEGTLRRWVVQSLDLPTENNTEARALGLDIDENGTADNQLGMVVVAINGLGEYDLDLETNALIAAGEILHLLDVQATSTTDAAGVGLRITHGLDTDGIPDDNFSGSESFGSNTTRGEGLVSGHIAGGRLDVRYGTAPIAVTFPGLDEPFVLYLVGARFEATLTPSGELIGRFGGAIPAEGINTGLIPILHTGLNRRIAQDCPDGVCEPGSFGLTLLQVFDANGDGAMTLEELRTSSLTQSLLSPDLDLRIDGEPYEPGCVELDGRADALSVGAGFRAVPAAL